MLGQGVRHHGGHVSVESQKRPQQPRRAGPGLPSRAGRGPPGCAGGHPGAGGTRTVKGTRTRCVQNKTAWPSPCPLAGKGPQSKRRLPGSISTTINTRSRLSKRSSKCQTSAKGQVAETSGGRTEAGAGGVSRVCSHVPRATRRCHGRSGDSDGDPATRWLQESEGDPHEGGREGAPRPGSKRTRASGPQLDRDPGSCHRGRDGVCSGVQMS